MEKFALDYFQFDSKVQMEETEDEIIFKNVIMAREIVQPYETEDGDIIHAYKPAKELEKAVIQGRAIDVCMNTHPPNIVPDRNSLIHGAAKNIRFVKNLLDHKTKRPNQRGLIADIHFFKFQLSDEQTELLLKIPDKNAKVNRDNSIGFFYTEDSSSGKWNNTAYDVVQRDICLNHLAAPIPAGRCAMPLCGFGADSNTKSKNKVFASNTVYNRLVHSDPEETENYIHIPVRDKGDFVSDSFRTITISSKEGIKAVIGKLKSNPDGSTVIQKYMFDKEKDWTMEKAKSWVKQHKDEADRMFDSIPEFMKPKIEKATDTVTAAADMTLEEIETKIAALKKQRDKIQEKIDKWYKDYPPQADPTPKELDDLYDKLSDVYLEISAYTEAKIQKIASNGDANKPWYTRIDWKQHTEAFDALNDKTKQLIVDAGLCPSCDYDKAPEDTTWNFAAKDYSPEQLSYASSVIVMDGTVHGFGYTSEDLTKTDCKLPHHLPGDGKTHGGKLIWHGVDAAGKALMGARGANIKGDAANKAKAHLAKHYKEFDKTPPWQQKDSKKEEKSVEQLTAESKRLLSHPDLIT